MAESYPVGPQFAFGELLESTSTSTGTGTLLLDDLVSNVYPGLAAYSASTSIRRQMTSYAVFMGSDYEIGVTHTNFDLKVASDHALERLDDNEVIVSTNSNNRVNWGAGKKSIIIGFNDGDILNRIPTNFCVNDEALLQNAADAYFPGGATIRDGIMIRHGWCVYFAGMPDYQISNTLAVTHNPGPSRAKSLVVLQEADAGNNKYAVANWLNAQDSEALRGKQITFSVDGRWIRADQIKLYILEWAGSGNQIPDDPVTTWNAEGTDPDLVANLTIVAESPSSSVPGQDVRTLQARATIGASVNNLGFMIIYNAQNTSSNAMHIFKGAVQLGKVPSPIREYLEISKQEIISQTCWAESDQIRESHDNSSPEYTLANNASSFVIANSNGIAYVDWHYPSWMCLAGTSNIRYLLTSPANVPYNATDTAKIATGTAVTSLTHEGRERASFKVEGNAADAGDLVGMRIRKACWCMGPTTATTTTTMTTPTTTTSTTTTTTTTTSTTTTMTTPTTTTSTTPGI